MFEILKRTDPRVGDFDYYSGIVGRRYVFAPVEAECIPNAVNIRPLIRDRESFPRRAALGYLR